MEPAETEKQVRSFIGKIQYISRFISKLSITCEPIFRLLKKNQPTEWNTECQEAFEKIKDYLTHPPILSPPKPGNPLVLYMSVEDLGVGAMLAQANESEAEHAIYYISKKLSPNEIKYSLIEKTCLAVVWAIKKLQHYFKSYKVMIVSKMDPMQYLYRTPTLAGKLSRWLILLSEFDIEFVTKKTVKGRVVADFLAENPVEETDEWELAFPDEHLAVIEEEVWKLFFDGSANKYGAGAGVVLETPNGEVITICKKLMFPVTNNMAEYEACILGLESLIAAGAKVVEVVGDSKLVIEHARGSWEVKEEKLKPYIECLKQNSSQFERITFTHIGRIQDKIPDALANLASAWEDLDTFPKKPFIVSSGSAPCYSECYVDQVEEDEKPWFHDLKEFMEKGIFSEDASPVDGMTLRKMAKNYVLVGGVLYRRSWDGLLLRCESSEEGNDLMEKIH